MSRPCGFAGCSEPEVARGVCATHYQQWARAGRPDGGPLGSGALYEIGTHPGRFARAAGAEPTTLLSVRIPTSLLEQRIDPLRRRPDGQADLPRSHAVVEALREWAEERE